MTGIWALSTVECVDAKVQITEGSPKPHHETLNYLMQFSVQTSEKGTVI